MAVKSRCLSVLDNNDDFGDVAIDPATSMGETPIVVVVVVVVVVLVVVAHSKLSKAARHEGSISATVLLSSHSIRASFPPIIRARNAALRCQE